MENEYAKPPTEPAQTTTPQPVDMLQDGTITPQPIGVVQPTSNKDPHPQLKAVKAVAIFLALTMLAIAVMLFFTLSNIIETKSELTSGSQKQSENSYDLSGSAKEHLAVQKMEFDWLIGDGTNMPDSHKIGDIDTTDGAGVAKTSDGCTNNSWDCFPMVNYTYRDGTKVFTGAVIESFGDTTKWNTRWQFVPRGETREDILKNALQDMMENQYGFSAEDGTAKIGANFEDHGGVLGMRFEYSYTSKKYESESGKLSGVLFVHDGVIYYIRPPANRDSYGDSKEGALMDAIFDSFIKSIKFSK
ncbi:MAG: hypothetical protein LBG75_03595 [Candidatus Nomurabacteria bacterium]|jgi:hypothetical protein|nr:hypothetical protein [Candidatus Nomurabacteria bacterium]